jgi:sialidase-1
VAQVSVPYEAGSGGYHTFRIPAVVRTPSGALAAFAEARHDGPGDTGNIDLVLRHSTDGGLTWGPMRLVVEHGTDTAGNPAPVVVPATGDLVVVSCRNGGAVDEAQIMRGEVSAEDSRRVYVQRSADGGLSWTAPDEITAQVKAPDWRWYATGPGHGVATASGRLVIPANHSAGDRYGGHAIFSDDGGVTWRIGFVDSDPGGSVRANETAAAELPDGRLYFNTRVQDHAEGVTRADAYSKDGGLTLIEPYRPQTALDTPVVQGSVLQMPGRGPLLYAGPGHPAKRVAMTIWVSDDDGATWRVGRRITDLPSGYSDLVSVDEATVGLLYETGSSGPYENLTFTRIPLSEIL